MTSSSSVLVCVCDTFMCSVKTTHDFQPNGEWDVFHTTATWNLAVLDCCPGIGYAHVVFTLHMKVPHTNLHRR